MQPLIVFKILLSDSSIKVQLTGNVYRPPNNGLFGGFKTS